MTVFSGGGGAFSFENMPPGAYDLIETQPEGYSDGKDCSPFNTCSSPPDTDRFYGIALAPAQTVQYFRFGERQAGLSGYVYVDGNLDNLRQPTETVLSSISVLLTGTTYLNQSVVRSTNTNGGGFYGFGDLVTGTYRISLPSQPLASGTESLHCFLEIWF